MQKLKQSTNVTLRSSKLKLVVSISYRPLDLSIVKQFSQHVVLLHVGEGFSVKY
jgi:hypothetical protein